MASAPDSPANRPTRHKRADEKNAAPLEISVENGSSTPGGSATPGGFYIKAIWNLDPKGGPHQVKKDPKIYRAIGELHRKSSEDKYPAVGFKTEPALGRSEYDGAYEFHVVPRHIQQSGEYYYRIRVTNPSLNQCLAVGKSPTFQID